MAKAATEVRLSGADRAELEGWVRASTAEQRLVLRARIVLAAAAGTPTARIARVQRLRPATVSKWRTRFVARGLAGLQDDPRPGPARRYDAAVERRVLAELDQKPPAGHATWTARLLARALGDIPRHHVWRILHSHGIQLQRRRSWCVSTDRQFAPKAADIVGLYLNPPVNAVVLSVDEKPSIQAIERASGYVETDSGKVVRGLKSTYKRHGTLNLFAALEVGTGQVKTKFTEFKKREDFRGFLDGVLADQPQDAEIHVILDNYSPHKRNDDWLAKFEGRVRFHFTPTFSELAEPD